jgi:hypothetical protein
MSTPLRPYTSLRAKKAPPLTAAQEAALLRQVDAELGLERHTGLKGILLGTLIVAGLSAGVGAVVTPIGPSTLVYGRVESVGIKPYEYGIRRTAWVRTGERYGMVRLPAGAMCAPGDRIELRRSPTLVRTDYRVGPGGCARAR